MHPRVRRRRELWSCGSCGRRTGGEAAVHPLWTTHRRRGGPRVRRRRELWKLWKRVMRVEDVEAVDAVVRSIIPEAVILATARP